MVYTWYYDKDSLILDKMPVPVPLLPRRPWLMHRSFFYNGRANLPAWLCGHGKRPISLSHTGRSGWPCGPFWRAFRPVLQCAGTQDIAQCGPWHDFLLHRLGPAGGCPFPRHGCRHYPQASIWLRLSALMSMPVVTHASPRLPASLPPIGLAVAAFASCKAYGSLERQVSASVCGHGRRFVAMKKRRATSPAAGVRVGFL